MSLTAELLSMSLKPTGLARARSEGKRLGRPPIAAELEKASRRPAADLTHFSRYDIPCAVYGPGGRLHPDVHGQMHSAGEHIHVDDVVAAARVYLAAALDITNQIPMAREVSN